MPPEGSRSLLQGLLDPPLIYGNLRLRDFIVTKMNLQKGQKIWGEQVNLLAKEISRCESIP